MKKLLKKKSSTMTAEETISQRRKKRSNDEMEMLKSSLKDILREKLALKAWQSIRQSILLKELNALGFEITNPQLSSLFLKLISEGFMEIKDSTLGGRIYRRKEK